MAGISGMLTGHVSGLLVAPDDGVNVRLMTMESGSMGLVPEPIREITTQNASVENAERSGRVRYPALCIYCEKLSNSMREKFRTFSGKASMVVEVRHSQDHLDQIESRLQLYVDAVCGILDDSRGDWGGGAFYGGGYEVTYEPAARGGKNFLQRAKVKFEVEVSK